MGLSTDTSFVARLLHQIKAEKERKSIVQVENDMKVIDEPKTNIELMTLKNFINVFEYDKFGEKACKAIYDEFNYKLKV